MPSGDDDDVVDASEDHPLTLRDDDVAGARRRDAAERRSTSARVGQLKGNNAIK